MLRLRLKQTPPQSYFEHDKMEEPGIRLRPLHSNLFQVTYFMVISI